MEKQNLDCFFHPRSIAIAGVSTKGIHIRMGAGVILDASLGCGFKGPIYPINPKGGEVLGLKVYTNIKDVPGPVDYAVCSIPALQVPQFIQDCAAKEVKAIHIYSGGFSENGTNEGKRLEKEITTLARQNDIRVIGPNCVGIYIPEAGLSFCADLPKESGSVALICQSGGNSILLTREATARGVRFSKVISYGNACDVNESDLLEHLAADVNTKVITFYIEGVKDGRRFNQLLRETAKSKPVVVLKGGLSEAGARAAASHTGALTGSTEIWNTLLHQAGVIKVDTLEELADMMVTFDKFPLPTGRRMGILGGGGGAAVLTTDYFTNAGLIVPRFPQEIQSKLSNYLPKGLPGVSLSNPVDISDQGWNICYDCAKVMLDYDIDLLICQFPIGQTPFDPTTMAAAGARMVEDIIKTYKESTKPMAAVFHSAVTEEDHQQALGGERMCSEVGLPLFHSLPNAAKAIGRFMDYHERRQQRSGKTSTSY